MCRGPLSLLLVACATVFAAHAAVDEAGLYRPIAQDDKLTTEPWCDLGVGLTQGLIYAFVRSGNTSVVGDRTYAFNGSAMVEVVPTNETGRWPGVLFVDKEGKAPAVKIVDYNSKHRSCGTVLEVVAGSVMGVKGPGAITEAAIIRVQTDTALVRTADVAVLQLLLPPGGLTSPLRFNTSWRTWSPAARNHFRTPWDSEFEMAPSGGALRLSVNSSTGVCTFPVAVVTGTAFGIPSGRRMIRGRARG